MSIAIVHTSIINLCYELTKWRGVLLKCIKKNTNTIFFCYSSRVNISTKKVYSVTCSTFREKIRQKCLTFSVVTVEYPLKGIRHR